MWFVLFFLSGRIRISGTHELNWLTMFVVNGGGGGGRHINESKLARWKSTLLKEQTAALELLTLQSVFFMTDMGGRNGGKLSLPVELWLLAVIMMWLQFHFWSSARSMHLHAPVSRRGETFLSLVFYHRDHQGVFWSGCRWNGFELGTSTALFARTFVKMRPFMVCISQLGCTVVLWGAAAYMFEVITMETNCCFAPIRVWPRLT